MRVSRGLEEWLTWAGDDKGCSAFGSAFFTIVQPFGLVKIVALRWVLIGVRRMARNHFANEALSGVGSALIPKQNFSSEDRSVLRSIQTLTSLVLLPPVLGDYARCLVQPFHVSGFLINLTPGEKFRSVRRRVSEWFQ